MINQNWWFSTLLIKQFKYCPPLNKSIKCDVLIVGAGFSGMSAAAEFLQKGFSVVLRQQMQCWDSKLVYSYFRLTGDNRLLLGGGSPLSTFLPSAYNGPFIIKKVIKEFKGRFPHLKDLSFIQFWPGLIDTTRDLLPIIVKPPGQPHLQFILGIVGLPWATFAGSFAARNILGDAEEDYAKYYPYFSNRRHFALPSALARMVGKPALFSLANSWAKFYQVDTHRKPVALKDEF